MEYIEYDENVTMNSKGDIVLDEINANLTKASEKGYITAEEFIEIIITGKIK